MYFIQGLLFVVSIRSLGFFNGVISFVLPHLLSISTQSIIIINLYFSNVLVFELRELLILVNSNLNNNCLESWIIV